VVTKERFEQGMTLRQYIDQMSVNKDRFVEALDEIALEPAGARMLERLGAARRLLVRRACSAINPSKRASSSGSARRSSCTCSGL